MYTPNTTQLAFSKDGSKLASVGLDLDHSIAVWDWRRGARIATAPGHTDKIFEARCLGVYVLIISKVCLFKNAV